MSSETPTPRELANSLVRAVDKCRCAQSAEELHAKAYRKPWNQRLLDAFGEQCAKDPNFHWIRTMLWAQARQDLAEKLLPVLEQCLGRYVYEEFTGVKPSPPLRPELVVDNSGGAGAEAPPASPGKGKRNKGKWAARRRPPGDAA